MQVAYVAEEACIGCAACLKVCPTGALVGAVKHIYSVMPLLCTGCGACVASCPVPCITMQPWDEDTHPLQGHNNSAAEAAIARHTARMANPIPRMQQQGITAAPVQVGNLSPELAALAEAARAKAQARYAQKGPPKRPSLGS